MTSYCNNSKEYVLFSIQISNRFAQEFTDNERWSNFHKTCQKYFLISTGNELKSEKYLIFDKISI